jgi:hypothetical protein
MALLASTAILSLGIGEAGAACNLTSSPNSVICAANTTTTLTTNTDAGNPSSSDDRQVFTTGGAVTATVNAGVTVNGNGLTIDTTAEAGPASAITFVNNGSVTRPSVSGSAARRQLRRQWRGAGARLRAGHGRGRAPMAHRLVGCGDLRRRIFRRHALIRRQGRGAVHVVST